MGTIQGADLIMTIRHCQAVLRWRQLDENGADEVKLEGGSRITGHVAQRLDFNIAVLADIGLVRQKVISKCGFPTTGRTDEEAEQLATDASATHGAGVFSIVMEGIIEPFAVSITAKCPIPSISIGTSPDCNRQFLVIDEILGLDEGFTPTFVEKYADLHTDISAATATFHKSVVNKTFPQDQHLFWLKN